MNKQWISITENSRCLLFLIHLTHVSPRHAHMYHCRWTIKPQSQYTRLNHAHWDLKLNQFVLKSWYERNVSFQWFYDAKFMPRYHQVRPFGRNVPFLAELLLYQNDNMCCLSNNSNKLDCSSTLKNVISVPVLQFYNCTHNLFIITQRRGHFATVRLWYRWFSIACHLLLNKF